MPSAELRLSHYSRVAADARCGGGTGTSVVVRKIFSPFQRNKPFYLLE